MLQELKTPEGVADDAEVPAELADDCGDESRAVQHVHGLRVGVVANGERPLDGGGELSAGGGL